MFKTSRFMEEIGHPASDSLTPIRDYDNDHFHKHDDRLPMIQRFPYGKPANYKESIRGSAKSFKRPASLVLSDQAAPSNKKQYSPMNWREFAKVVQLDNGCLKNGSVIDTRAAEFFKVVRNLYEAENRYIELMEISNLVYRKVLHNNKSFKSKLIKKESHEELLLFGNIETITSISKLFLASLDSILTSPHYSTVDDQLWDELNKNPSLQQQVMESFDIGKTFSLHFLRIKSTYLTYSVTHRKQMELLELLRAGSPHLFQKWHDCCIKSAKMNKLEDIFKRPMHRLLEWNDTLMALLQLSKDLLDVPLYDSIALAQKQYVSFAEYVANETKEFDENVMYDFSLTPLEIIQSYGPDLDPNQDNAKKCEGNMLHPAEQSSTFMEPENSKGGNKSCGRAASVFSGSSSRYSGDSTLVPADASKPIGNSHASESHASELETHTTDDSTLADYVTRLKKIHRGLLQLKDAINKEEMLSILDVSLKIAKSWEAVIESEADFKAVDPSNPEVIFVTSMYSAYVNKLQTQREHATLLKVNEMEKTVKAPLSMIIGLCDSVRCQLRDLNTLKKDYMAFLREGKTFAHDVKREIIRKHFEHMQRKMLFQLPQFIDLAYQAIEVLILNYHKMILKYLEISAGGDMFLIRDLEILGKVKKDVGRNFDILQSFSTSRYHSKRMVRDNWQFAQDPTASRVLRKLFEL